jgi:outer membrane protein
MTRPITSVVKTLGVSFVSAFITFQVNAYDSGTFLFRGGAAVVEAQESSSDIRITNPPLGDSTGAKVGVANDTQLGLTLAYKLTDNIGIELLAATPFKHDITGAGVLAGVGKLGDIKHLPPTLSVQYYPMGANSAIQPYVGAGLNYTIFFEESTSSTLNNAGTIDFLAGLAGAPAGTITSVSSQDLDLDNSFGLAAQVGIDFMITEKFGVNAAVWWIDIDTEATITSSTNIGDVTAKVDVEIDPFVYMVGVTYLF